ncbi:MAG: hypothetical protein JW741_22545 [Sedimentisphaerales bacterium]|nr:hypothetical protein [Sedimentisphaerales bacterium]
MKRLGFVILAMAILGAAAGSFWVGRLGATGRGGHGSRMQHGWLQGAPDRVARAERQFQARSSRLADSVRHEQALLSSALADPCSTGEEILAQVDRVIESHELLMRAVGEHLATLSNRLPRAQVERLMGSCVSSLRGQVQRRYRWRGGAHDDSSWETPGDDGRGRYGWGAPGQGAGHGRQFRGGRNDGHGLGPRLGLSEEQIAWSQQRDPGFEEDCMRLKERLGEAHAALVGCFEHRPVGDAALLARIDDLVEAHNRLERRVARHVVLLRPCLSREQLERLSRFCRGRRGPDGADSISTGRFRMHRFGFGYLSESVLGNSL